MPTPQIFDRHALRLHRERAAAARGHNFLQEQMHERLVERLSELDKSFPLALCLGSFGGHASIAELVQAELPEEECLPSRPGYFDLVLACGALHWVNDLPGVLSQIRHLLNPGGLFLAVFPGGETLHELRDALMQSSLSEEGGAAPRVSPFVDVRDAGALLQRARFAEPVADVERLHVQYANPLALMHDLRAMGETNALIERPGFLRRATLAAAEKYYERNYAEGAGIRATFDLIGMAGWK